MYEAVCPNGHRLQVPIEHAGMKLRCPACNSIFQLQLPNGSAPSAAGPASGSPAGAATTAPSSPSGAAAAASTTAADAGGRWSGTDSPPPPSSTPAPAPAPTRPTTPAAARFPFNLSGQTHLWSQAVLVVGLLLALSARGCEGVAAKNVVRLQGQVDLEQRLFDEQRESALLVIQQKLDDQKISAAIRTQLQKEHDDKQAEFDKRRKELQAGDWRLLANEAARATAENRAAGYWRELLFVCGSLLLAFGLAATALTGQGAERWVCFGLLAIIVFSLYVGGMAWSAALLPNLR